MRKNKQVATTFWEKKVQGLCITVSEVSGIWVRITKEKDWCTKNKFRWIIISGWRSKSRKNIQIRTILSLEKNYRRSDHWPILKNILGSSPCTLNLRRVIKLWLYNGFVCWIWVHFFFLPFLDKVWMPSVSYALELCTWGPFFYWDRVKKQRDKIYDARFKVGMLQLVHVTDDAVN